MSRTSALALAPMLAALLLPACRASEPAATAAQASTARPALVEAASMPSPRAAHSATKLPGGKVLLAGGCNADGCEEGISGDALLFDPSSGRFLPAGAMVHARVGHRAVALGDGSVLLFGGFTPSGVTDAIERYDPRTGRFEPHGRMLLPRDGFSATLLRDGSILLAGGYGEGMRRLADAERYDPATNASRRVGPMSVERMSHTATMLPDGRVLLAGGSRSAREVLASLEVFDPATDRFSPAGTLARARHKHAAIALGEGVLILGGASIPESRAHFDDSEWWTPQGVTAGPGMARGRYKFLDSLATLADGSTLVGGGGATAELLDAGGMRFHPTAGDIGTALAFASATSLDDGRVLLAGGYDADIRPTRRAWLLAPPPRIAPAAPHSDD